MRILVLASLVTALACAQAQDTPAPTPPPRIVRLHFVPPPLEGTISLGIYDSSGKLVRVLQREADISDFTAGHDALETTWDGSDDAGNPLPPGKYRAHGYLVGDLQVEGVDSFFNDWVTEESSPHIARITQIETRESFLQIKATTVDGKTANFLFNPATEKLTAAEPSANPAPLPNNASLLIEPIASANGKDGTVWAITHLAKDAPGVEVVQLSPEPAVLRKLSIEPGEPQPIGIAASRTEDKIFLLEESPALARVRGLTLQSTSNAAGQEQTVSDWKVDFEKKIVRHENFALQNGVPVTAPNDSESPPPKLTQTLRPNPLDRDRPGKIDLAVGFNEDGSYLQTVDGLPLRTVSDTGQLKRTVIALHGGHEVDVFEDDGAVVEQFRVSRLEEMMAFDCGDFELK